MCRAWRPGRDTRSVIVDGVIDWDLAERIAGMVAGEAGHGTPRPDLAEVAARSEAVVGAYTGLRAPGALPAPELVARPDWVRANLRSLRPSLEPVTEKL